MLMKQPCCSDKLCSKSKLFLIRSLCESKDSRGGKIIGREWEMKQAATEDSGPKESFDMTKIYVKMYDVNVSIKYYRQIPFHIEQIT